MKLENAILHLQAASTAQTVIQSQISQKISCKLTLKTDGLCSTGTTDCLTFFLER